MMVIDDYHVIAIRSCRDILSLLFKSLVGIMKYLKIRIIIRVALPMETKLLQRVNVNKLFADMQSRHIRYATILVLSKRLILYIILSIISIILLYIAYIILLKVVCYPLELHKMT